MGRSDPRHTYVPDVLGDDVGGPRKLVSGVLVEVNRLADVVDLGWDGDGFILQHEGWAPGRRNCRRARGQRRQELSEGLVGRAEGIPVGGEVEDGTLTLEERGADFEEVGADCVPLILRTGDKLTDEIVVAQPAHLLGHPAGDGSLRGEPTHRDRVTRPDERGLQVRLGLERHLHEALAVVEARGEEHVSHERGQLTDRALHRLAAHDHVRGGVLLAPDVADDARDGEATRLAADPLRELDERFRLRSHLRQRAAKERDKRQQAFWDGREVERELRVDHVVRKEVVAQHRRGLLGRFSSRNFGNSARNVRERQGRNTLHE